MHLVRMPSRGPQKQRLSEDARMDADGEPQLQVVGGWPARISHAKTKEARHLKTPKAFHAAVSPCHSHRPRAT
jgi:hypothetical protein